MGIACIMYVCQAVVTVGTFNAGSKVGGYGVLCYVMMHSCYILCERNNIDVSKNEIVRSSIFEVTRES